MYPNAINIDALLKVPSQHPAAATSSALRASIVALQGTCWLCTFESNHIMLMALTMYAFPLSKSIHGRFSHTSSLFLTITPVRLELF